MNLRCKLPGLGTTIFTVQSRRALELGAVNVGQGFPDYPIDPQLAASVSAAMQDGHNQYAPMPGMPQLRAAIAAKLAACHGIDVDPAEEITVSCGGTEALFSAIQATVGAGDEVILFDPAYDAYEPAVRLAGGVCQRIALQPPEFRVDWARVASKINARTRLVIINNPQNPACSILARSDLDELARLLRGSDTLVLADEVYEHVVFDGLKHQSVLAHSELRARSFAVYSFGKTLHATGWRVGYCVAPAPLTAEFRKVHQFNTFTIATPLQIGIARYLLDKPACWQGLADFFAPKRAALRAALSGSGFELRAGAGTYFQLLDYSALSDENDIDFCERLMVQAGVATIPLSPFYRDAPPLRLLRVCIAKSDDTLAQAAERLRRFADAQGSRS